MLERGLGCREDYTYTEEGLLETLFNKKADSTVVDSYSYTYDAAHNQIEKTGEEGTATYTYDDLNRLLTVSEPSGKATAYTYDSEGNRLTQTEVKEIQQQWTRPLIMNKIISQNL